MSLIAAIHARRSIKEFTSKPIARDEIERLLDAAAQAPNHRLTQPWRFYVLGPEARRAYGAALGGRKAKKVADADAAALVDQLAGGRAHLHRLGVADEAAAETAALPFALPPLVPRGPPAAPTGPPAPPPPAPRPRPPGRPRTGRAARRRRSPAASRRRR